MIRAGYTFENPRTGSRITVLEADAETGSRGWLLELRCKPGAPPDVPEHLHRTWTEEYEIVVGTAQYKLDGRLHSAGPGDNIVVAPGQLHVHPWAVDTEMIHRQRNDFGGVDPSAVTDVMGVFATLARLAAAGKLDKDGLPKDPLQLAVTMRTLAKHGGYDAKLPPAAQDFLSATLGRVAEWLGYRGVDPRLTG